MGIGRLRAAIGDLGCSALASPKTLHEERQYKCLVEQCWRNDKATTYEMNRHLQLSKCSFRTFAGSRQALVRVASEAASSCLTESLAGPWMAVPPQQRLSRHQVQTAAHCESLDELA